MKIHCLFEQSGTFRDVFRKLGFEAYDYDIDNQFKKTDYQIDLFEVINNGTFDFISDDDFVFAFFPCTFFSGQQVMHYNTTAKQFRNYTDLDRIEYNQKKMNALFEFYNTFLTFYKFLIKNKIRAVIENPYSSGNFLSRYFPFLPKIIIQDRTVYGDFFKKPTQFFFVNFEPDYKMMDFYYFTKKVKNVSKTNAGIYRSLISTNFAENFIKTHLMEILTK